MRDSKEFDRIFQEWYPSFFYFASHYVRDEEACKDIVSETFEFLWKNYEKIEKDRAKVYLLTTVKSKCIDYLRRRSMHKNYIRYITEVNDTYFKEEEPLEIELRIACVRESMKKLTPYNRHILEQCYIHRKKYKEVAEELQVSVAAIHTNIVKALRILRDEVKKGNQKER